jgi:hypothetical protein
VLQGLQFGIGAHITLQVVACASPARLPVSAGTGPIPELPAPKHSPASHCHRGRQRDLVCERSGLPLMKKAGAAAQCQSHDPAPRCGC